ncbi:MAG: hypothetical protein KG003_11015 [Bacteroidetes bacterium]|nr:hypothetical protein [Bacteroidota bacterium]
MDNNNSNAGMVPVKLVKRRSVIMFILGILVGMAIMWFLYTKCLLPKSGYMKCCTTTTDTIGGNDYITNHVAYSADSSYVNCTGCDSFLMSSSEMGYLLSNTQYLSNSDMFYSLRNSFPRFDSKGVRMHRCVLETLLKTLSTEKPDEQYIYFRYGIENVAGVNKIFLMARGGNNWMAASPPAGTTFGPEMLPVTYRSGTHVDTYCPMMCR